MTTPTVPLLRLILPTLLLAPLLRAQEKKESPIQDNSFLIEEAYNQEQGVVQHISTFTRAQASKDWIYTFTQEWPAGGLAHQLSFTLPWQRLGADGRQAFGDMALNYRYQLVGDGAASVAVSPRFSVLLPTGDEKRGYGKGSPGFQVSLPVSFTMGDVFVGHFNAGSTLTPRASNPSGDRANAQDFMLGQSFIWLASSRVNAMLEFLYTNSAVVTGPGQTQRQRASFLSPGIRWAHNFASGLQIVPGIAIPIGVGASRGEKAIFLYLSFEHPFMKTK